MTHSVIKRSSKLSANQQLVFDTLKAESGPLTAYEVIDRVSTGSVWAPPTVYRALKRLIDEGLVHRLESQNAFLACTRSHQSEAWNIFTICENCGATQELSDDDIATRLKDRAAENDFLVAKMTLELRGVCKTCTNPKIAAT